MPLMRYVSKCIPKQMRLKPLPENVGMSDGSRRSSGSTFQAIGPVTENARQPSVLRRCRGTRWWWWLEDRSRWRLATSDMGWQQFMRYCGALPWRHRWTVTPSLWSHTATWKLATVMTLPSWQCDGPRFMCASVTTMTTTLVFCLTSPFPEITIIIKPLKIGCECC